MNYIYKKINEELHEINSFIFIQNNKNYKILNNKNYKIQNISEVIFFTKEISEIIKESFLQNHIIILKEINWNAQVLLELLKLNLYNDNIQSYIKYINILLTKLNEVNSTFLNNINEINLNELLELKEKIDSFNKNSAKNNELITKILFLIKFIIFNLSI